jgi:hypothetical protein
MLAETRWIDGREPDAGLVDAVELGDKVFEVDVVVRVVVEDELLEVPAMWSVSCASPKRSDRLTIATRHPESPSASGDGPPSAGKCAWPLPRYPPSQQAF